MSKYDSKNEQMFYSENVSKQEQCLYKKNVHISGNHSLDYRANKRFFNMENCTGGIAQSVEYCTVVQLFNSCVWLNCFFSVNLISWNENVFVDSVNLRYGLNKFKLKKFN